MIPTTEPLMTLQELTEAFRANLIPTSEENEARFIMAGKYPFAQGVEGKKQRIYKIWREPFYKWLAEQVPYQVVRDREQE